MKTCVTILLIVCSVAGGTRFRRQSYNPNPLAPAGVCSFTLHPVPTNSNGPNGNFGSPNAPFNPRNSGFRSSAPPPDYASNQGFDPRSGALSSQSFNGQQLQGAPVPGNQFNADGNANNRLLSAQGPNFSNGPGGPQVTPRESYEQYPASRSLPQNPGNFQRQFGPSPGFNNSPYPLGQNRGTFAPSPGFNAGSGTGTGQGAISTAPGQFPNDGSVPNFGGNLNQGSFSNNLPNLNSGPIQVRPGSGQNGPAFNAGQFNRPIDNPVTFLPGQSAGPVVSPPFDPRAEQVPFSGSGIPPFSRQVNPGPSVGNGAAQNFFGRGINFDNRQSLRDNLGYAGSGLVFSRESPPYTERFDNSASFFRPQIEDPFIASS